jgi:hypothetical protein
MTGRLGDLDRLGFVRRGLGEPAELGEAHDQPAAVEDRYGLVGSKRLVDPVGGQRREVVGRQLDHPLVLAPVVLGHIEIARGEDAESQVPEALGDPQRARAGHERLIQLAEYGVGDGREGARPASPGVVVQPLGEVLGFAQPPQRPPNVTEMVQHRP